MVNKDDSSDEVYVTLTPTKHRQSTRYQEHSKEVNKEISETVIEESNDQDIICISSDSDRYVDILV